MAKLFRAAIMGPPGSGKGTISKRIADRFGLQYLSSGHFLRDCMAANTEAGVMVRTYVERSMLVPDHVMTRLMLPRLEQLMGHSWLLDARFQANNNNTVLYNQEGSTGFQRVGPQMPKDPLSLPVQL